jgi:hypothetical protein
MRMLRERIDDLAEKHGSLRAAARVLQVDPGYLSRLRAGEKEWPSDELLRKLKLRRIVLYVDTTDAIYDTRQPHTDARNSASTKTGGRLMGDDETLVKQLLDCTTDFDGSQMEDGENPRCWCTCALLREAAHRIKTLNARLMEATNATQ